MILMLRLREKLSCCFWQNKTPQKNSTITSFFGSSTLPYHLVVRGKDPKKDLAGTDKTSVDLLRITTRQKHQDTNTTQYLTSHKSYLVTNTQLNRAKEDQTTPITCFSSKYAPFIKSWIGSSKSFQR